MTIRNDWAGWHDRVRHCTHCKQPKPVKGGSTYKGAWFKCVDCRNRSAYKTSTDRLTAEKE